MEKKNIFLCLFLSLVLLSAFFFGGFLFSLEPVTASAESQEVTLTVPQTIALFGNYIPFSVSDSSYEPHDYTFYYYTSSIELSHSLVPNSAEQNLYIWDYYSTHSQAEALAASLALQKSPWCIYRCAVPVDELDLYLYGQAYNIDLSISLDLESIGYTGCFGYTTSTNAIDQIYTPASAFVNVFSDNGSTSYQYLHNSNNAALLAYTPTVSGGSDYHSDPDYDSLLVSIPVDTTYNLTGFSRITGFSLYGNRLYGRNVDPIFPNVPAQYYVYLFIQCPTLNDYHAPITTAPITSTRTTNSSTATSLSRIFTGNSETLDTRLNAIIDNQNVQISQLNAILNELNMIYTAMVARGELPVNLVPADPLNTLPANMMTQMHDALAGFTTVRLPDEEIDRGMDIIGLVFDLTGDDPSLIFFSVFSGLSLVVAVVSWFIFKGRG